ncbi:MAG: Protein of unknown function (FYDLN_acid) [Deltaproteobacteria bacterium ADurb.Bin072]|nr:MAG: Protein of unknown function (FYDLN_acid) [Deltaproteobacteria bacterium ADurb.Bin072]
MQSLNKRTTSHPDKKKALPAVRKESPKSGVSLTGKKKPKEKKVVGKVGPQPRKKEALKAAAKPAQKPATPAAAKKPPVKAKPAAQAKKPVKKKEAPKAAAKPAQKPATPAAAKKPPVKAKPAAQAKKPVKKKEAPKAAAKPAQKPATPAAAKKPPVKAKPAAQAKKPVKKKEAPKVKGETFGAKVVSIEMDRTAEAKHAIRGEKIQARKVTVIPVDLGKRYKCYKCGIKFYDLGKPQPLCPSCGANQHDAVIKAARKRRGKHRSSYAAKTEPITVAPEETEDLHEVVGELDAEYVLDVDDIVLEEHHDAEDKE